MTRVRISSAVIYMFLVAGIIGLFGCAKPEQPSVESAAPAVPAAPAELPAPSDPAVLAPPQSGEVQAKIATIYQGTVSLDTSREEPYLTGDFNGDLYLDLAVIVKPVEGKLGDVNHELANWLRGDPIAKDPPPVSAPDPKNPAPAPDVHQGPVAVRMESSDILLAIIHGYGPDGWRNPEATQTYLLRHAVGKEMSMQPKKEILAAARKGVLMAPARGDVLREALGGQPGFIYYNGAKYKWFDPKTYKLEGPGQQSPH